MRKGVYPYDYVDSVKNIKRNKPSPKEAFYTTLYGEDISHKDQQVLYIATIFENFKHCKKHYSLNLAWYFTAPELAWDAALKMTKLELELLSNPDMLLMLENWIRGTITKISHRCAKANNKYMRTEFDSAKEFISYLDANELYAWAMSKQLLPCVFKLMSENELDDWKHQSCIPEVVLEYREHLHDLHNDYPLVLTALKLKRWRI